jgi:hypothetical protein
MGRVERAKPGRRFAPPRLRAWLCCCCTADGTVFCSVKARGGVCRVAMWRSISLPLPFGRVQDVYVTLERYFSRSDLVIQDQLVVCCFCLKKSSLVLVLRKLLCADTDVGTVECSNQVAEISSLSSWPCNRSNRQQCARGRNTASRDRQWSRCFAGGRYVTRLR